MTLGLEGLTQKGDKRALYLCSLYKMRRRAGLLMGIWRV